MYSFSKLGWQAKFSVLGQVTVHGLSHASDPNYALEPEEEGSFN